MSLFAPALLPADDADKRVYADETLRNPASSMQVALRLTGGDQGRAMFIHHNWPSDPIVLQRQAEVLGVSNERGGSVANMSREEFSAQLLRELDDTQNKDMRLKFYMLYAKVRGFTSDAVVSTTTVNHVMMMPAPTSQDDWEARATKQQAALVAEARVVNADFEKDNDTTR